MNRRYSNPSLLLVSAIFFLTIASPPGSVAQENHTARLIAGAKKEGSLIWYTSTGIEDIKWLFDAFTKKYPFIKMNSSTRAQRECSTGFSTKRAPAKFFSIS